MRGTKRTLLRLVAAVCAVALVAGGATGAFEYVRTYWLYRGFPPPSEPVTVRVHENGRTKSVRVVAGTEEVISVTSPALGGLSEPVYVYLPPGYFQHPTERYPVFYLLHGTPGLPSNFFRIADVGVHEDVLVAERRMRPMIIVSPTGSPSYFGDTEWVNGVHPHTGWETYMARDVVAAIDSRFRTLASGRFRAIGGDSEGGYGALDIALHHPGEFGVIESWSGYMLASHVPYVFGSHPSAAKVAYDSPLLQVATVAAALRRTRTYMWFFSGRRDSFFSQNVRFAAELTRLGIPHAFLPEAGGHSWALWRSMTVPALLAASAHMPSPGSGG